jgi:hypothetical protein
LKEVGMAFKGGVRAGNEIVATLKLDNSAIGEAHLIMAAGQSGRTPLIDAEIASPSGFARVVVTPQAKGVLEIVVDMAEQGDTGTLEVTAGGVRKHREPLTGDTFWSYTILAPEKAGPL